MKTRGIRNVISRTKLGAKVACLLSCGHTVIRTSGDGVRPTAICRECRAAKPTPKERLKRMRDTRARIIGAEGEKAK